MENLLSSLSPLQAAGQDGQMITMAVTFGLVIVIFYFMIIRPQNKRQKETERMLNELKKGDKIITIGGLRGEVQDVKEETIVIKVDADSNTKLEFNKNAIASLVNPPAPKKDDKKAEKAAEQPKS